MPILLSLILNALMLLVVAYLVPGITIESFWIAIVVAVVLGLVNAFIRPLLIILTLPINILTLGLFTLVINAVLLLLVATIVPGFSIDGFGAALIGGILIWLISMVTNGFGKNSAKQPMSSS